MVGFCSPVFQVLTGAQTFQLSVDHNTHTRAQRFTLRHAAITHARTIYATKRSVRKTHARSVSNTDKCDDIWGLVRPVRGEKNRSARLDNISEEIPYQPTAARIHAIGRFILHTPQSTNQKNWYNAYNQSYCCLQAAICRTLSSIHLPAIEYLVLPAKQ